MAISDAPWSNFKDSDYTDEQYKRATLYCEPAVASGDTTAKQGCKLPVREPNGALNRNGLKAAWGALQGSRGGVNLPADAKQKAITKLKGLYKQAGMTDIGPLAESKKTFQPDDVGLFVVKDALRREVTGPVMLPGCPDCDFQRGEKIFSEEEVADFCHAYNTKFRLADKMHTYGASGEVIGEAVENWTLKMETNVTNISGQTVTLPKGTWMATVKITDDDTWNKIESGVYKGFSGTYINEDKAHQLLKAINASKSMEPFTEYIGATKRVLIKDIDNPVPVTISIVDKPCVPNAIFTGIKSAEKAGRTISNNTLKKLNNAFNTVQNGLNNLKELLTTAESERQPKQRYGDPFGNPTSANKEVLDMDENELKQLIEKSIDDAVGKSIDDKLEPVKQEIQAIKEGLEAEPDPDPEDPAGKEDPEKPEETPDEHAEAIKALEDKNKELETELETIKKKLGEDPESNKREGQDSDPDENKSDKYVPRTDRDVFGRKIKE